MKKQYIIPELEVVKIVSTTTLLAGSDLKLNVDGETQMTSGWADGREFDFDDEEDSF